jgi:hypothetical protein
VVTVRLGAASGGERPTTSLPYTIPPHEYATIGMVERLAGCIKSGDLTTFGTLPVRLRVLGMTRTTEVPMPMTIRITCPPGTVCPNSG